MSDELKPCPFCGEVPPVSKKEWCTPIVGHACRILDLQITVPLHTWNTRAERTCRIEWRGEVYESEDCIEEDGSYFCTACDQELTGSLAEAWDDYQAWGYKGEQPFRNCPNCGAKIEGEGR